MNVKEKLVELLAEKCMETCKERGLNVCSAEHCNQHKEKCTGFYADHLIANGVTVQEWISVEEMAPRVTGKYICVVKDKSENTWVIPADWSVEMKTWFGEFGEIKNLVTHWMPLPEPPKGE